MKFAGLPLWALSLSAQRLRAAWRLLLVVIAIAISACTLVTSVGLLSFATEQGGLRSAFTALTPQQSGIDLLLFQPSVSVQEGRSGADKAIAKLLGTAGTSQSDAISSSEFLSVPQFDAEVPALAYFGEWESAKSHVTLLSGAWPDDQSAKPGEIGVALPEKAAKSFNLGVDSTFSTPVGDTVVTARVTGIYKPQHPSSAYWNLDSLKGKGYVAGFPTPDVSQYVPTNAMGPLLVAPGALAAAKLQLRFVDVNYSLNFSRVTVDELAPLLDRLNSANQDMALSFGLSTRSVIYTSELDDNANEIASALVVTRSTVVVVALLLLGLALAALGQAAKLLNDARSDERRPMRARGASDSQLLGLSVIEAVVIAVVTASLSPVLARFVYQALAAQGPMVAAHMPPDAGIPWFAWVIAAGVSALFALILIAPSLRRSSRFIDEDQGRHRQGRASGIMRSGLDLGIVVIAAVVYWQLQSYRTPVSYTASLAIDPVLVAGPAIMLLAGALLAVRLIPAASRLAARLELRTRGAMLALALWEVARRSRRITAAVLLLTLALAVGTFSQTFLSTWRQSQVDQAEYSVGAPVRVPADASLGGAQAALLANGAKGTPQPVIRRVAALGSPDDFGSGDGANPSTQADTIVLGLTAKARTMIDRGRLSDEGGATIRSKLTAPTGAVSAVPLPDDARGVAATVQIGNAENTLPGASAQLRAILQDANGLISTIDLGAVPLDGLEHSTESLFPPLAKGAHNADPRRLVGIQSEFSAKAGDASYDPGRPVRVDVLVKELSAVKAPPSTADPDAALPTVPLQLSEPLKWRGLDTDPFGQEPVTTPVPAGWQLRLNVDLPAGLDTQPAQYVMVGWTKKHSVPAVISTGLAKRLNISDGALLTLVFPDARVNVTIAGVVPLVPGSSGDTQLSANSDGSDTGQPDTIVVDQEMLSRALVESAVTDPVVDEWWVDVPAGHAQVYLDAHPDRPGIAPTRSAEVLALKLQQDPMRVSAQAALWLAIIGAALLAAVGFAMHTAAGMRYRRTEFAQLRAIGLSQRMLVGLVAAESLMLSILGVLFGVSLGVLLGWLVAPLIAVSPDGSPTVPSVQVIVPWLGVGGLVGVILAVLAIVVTTVAAAQKSSDPAGILRGADE